MKTTKTRWNNQCAVARCRKMASLLMVAFLATSLLGMHVGWAERVAARDVVEGVRHSMLTQKTKAPDLVKGIIRAAAYVGTASKGVGSKQAKPKKGDQPFIAALKKTQANLKALSAAMTGKDAKKLTQAMDRTGKSINELGTAYRLGETKNPKTDEGIKKLAAAFKAFRTNYGKEGLRKKKGGELSAAENQQIKALQDKYNKLAAELAKLKAKLGGSSFGKSPSGMAEFTRLSDALARILAPASSVTFDYYIYLLLFEEEFTGSWYAMSSYVSLTEPAFYSSFDVVDTYVVDINNYYFTTVETSFSYSSSEYFSYMEETSIDVTESYDVEITDTEVTESESYIEDVSLDVSADEYDITVGDEDDSIIDHDEDGTADSKDDDDDGDGTPDAKDDDDDGDGTPDASEEDDDATGGAASDAKKDDDDDDNDGIPDAKDNDDDNDGITDDKDADDDNDGTPDAKDADDDNDGTPDEDDADHDNDGDGTPDDQDADDDGDGTPDAQDNDDDGDGTPDASDSDDANDDADGGGGAADMDDDNDGTPDAQDTDDDNDGTPDAQDADDDNDGTPDEDDADHDNDGDGTPDDQDADDDGDGTPDAQDNDDDGDGTPDASDTDDANDDAGGDEPAGDDGGGDDEPGN